MSQSRLSRRRALRLGLGLCAAPLLPGCNIVGALAYKTVGPNEIDAEYKFPPLRPVLVLVENYQRGTLQAPADELAQFITTELEVHKAATLVGQEKLMSLRNDRTEQFNRMKIPDVGKTVGANLVLYVYLKESEIEGITGADVINGKVAATVRVVDVETAQTVFPPIGSDREFHATTDYVRKSTVDSVGVMQTQMLQDLSLQISKMFYKYRPEDESAGHV